jgi:hypothetical protein
MRVTERSESSSASMQLAESDEDINDNRQQIPGSQIDKKWVKIRP